MKIVSLCLLAIVLSSADASAQESPDQHVRAALLALEHLDSLKELPASWRPATFEIQAGGGVRGNPSSRGLEEAIPLADESLRVRGPVPLVRCTKDVCEAVERDFTPVGIRLLEPPYTGLEVAGDDLVITVTVPRLTPGRKVDFLALENLVVRVSGIGGDSPAASVIQRQVLDHRVRPRK